MTKPEIYAELQAWERVQKGLDAQLDLLYDLAGCQPDSPLPAAIYAVADAHTDAVARIVGDTAGAMEWWARECDFGNYLLSAGKGDKIRPIKTLKQLAGLIATE